MAEIFDIESKLIGKCRFCGAPLDGEFFDIFSILLDTLGDSSKSLYEAFEIATGIPISPADSSRSVCGICYTNLQRLVDVRQKSRSSSENIQQQQQLKLCTNNLETTNGKLSSNLRHCLICLNKETLTEIQRKTDLNPEENSNPSLHEIYELVTGVSLPDVPTFLCNNCMESLPESLRLRLPVKKEPLVIKKLVRLVKCTYCSETFSSVEDCKRHLETHQKERQNVCNICSKAFKSHEYLMKHTKKHSAEIQNKSSTCGVEFQDSVNLKSQNLCNSGELATIVPKVTKCYECSHCGKNFSSSEICKLHLKKIICNGRRNVCMICHKVFQRYEYLITHLEKHYTQDESKCSVCLVKYEDFLNYQEHFPCEINDYESEEANKSPTICNISQAEQIDSLQETKLNVQNSDENGLCFDVLSDQIESKHQHFCKICKIFLPDRHFYVHMDTHITDNYFFCKVCFKEFDNIAAYQYHALVDHSMDVCQKCTFMSETKTSLGRCYICLICSKQVKTTRDYKTHMRSVHDANPNFTCDICDRIYPYMWPDLYIDHMIDVHKVFPKEVKLLSQIPQTHMRIHKNDRQMVCKICLQEFRTFSTYLEHTDNEHPDNICKICSKVFTTPAILRKHVKKHWNTRKNLCNICTKLFPNLMSYQRHRRRKHNEYFCHICHDVSTYGKKMFLKYIGPSNNLKYHICSLCFKEFEKFQDNQTGKNLGKLFSYTTENLKALKLYLLRHPRNRSFCCEICSKSFVTLTELIVHTRKIHSAKELFKSDTPGIKHKQLAVFERHKRKGKKNMCKVCLVSFSNPQIFKQHLVTIDNFNYFCETDMDQCLCKICLMIFDSIPTCQAHFKAVHQKICKVCPMPMVVKSHSSHSCMPNQCCLKSETSDSCTGFMCNWTHLSV